MLKAVIFDMDGLLIDSERCTYEAYKGILRQYGYTIDMEFYVSILGTNAEYTNKRFIETYGTNFPIDEIKGKMHQYLNESFKLNGVPFKEGVYEMFDFLERKGIMIGVATSSKREWAEYILKSGNLFHRLKAITCGNEVENSKPNPEIFLKECKKLKVNPEEVIVFEDSENGIIAASDAGTIPVNVPDMKEPSDIINEKASYIISNLTEGIKLINNMI